MVGCLEIIVEQSGEKLNNQELRLYNPSRWQRR